MDTGIDHVTIVVEELEEAVGFFGALGFDESRRVVVSGETMAAYMGIPGWEADHVTLVHRDAPTHQEVQLLRFHQPRPAGGDDRGDLARFGYNHLCLRVRDLEATVRRVGELGFRPRNEVMHFHDRALVFLAGPGGTVVELAEWSVPPAREPPSPTRQQSGPRC